MYFPTSFLAALCLFCVSSAKAEVIIVYPTIGNVAGLHFGNALMAAQRYKMEKAKFNRRINALRTAWRKCDLKCANAKKLDGELAQLLFEKDYFYLVKNIAEQMAGVSGPYGFNRGQQSTLNIIDRSTGGALDKSLPRKCKFNFHRWSTCIHRAIKRKGGLRNRDGLMSAFNRCEPAYKPYQSCRDRIELAALPSIQAKLREQRKAMARPDAFKLVKHVLTTVPKSMSNMIWAHRRYFERMRDENPGMLPPKPEGSRTKPYITNYAKVYLKDRGMEGFMDHKKRPVLLCLYHNNPENWTSSDAEGRLIREYFWHKTPPAPVNDPAWRKALSPGNPILLIRPAVETCPTELPGSPSEFVTAQFREGEFRARK